MNWWASGLERANCYVEWTTQEQPEFSPDRRAYFSPAAAGQPQATLPMGGNDGGMELTRGETRTMIRMYRLPGWKGSITRPADRLRQSGAGAGRHQVVPHRLRYPAQHQQLEFHSRLPRLFPLVRRLDLPPRPDRADPHRHAFHDARVRHAPPQVRLHDLARPRGAQRRRATSAARRWSWPAKASAATTGTCSPSAARTPWPPFTTTTPLLDLAELEEQIAAHPQWNIATGADAFDPADLRKHAQEVKEYGTKRFWNEKTGRFGTVDLDGNLHDYGFTFLNNEAVYYDFATPEQARSIHAWLGGQRMVEGDTSTGKDIYHWRFGPRSTTRRNLDYYFWGWCNPESIPWGIPGAGRRGGAGLLLSRPHGPAQDRRPGRRLAAAAARS